MVAHSAGRLREGLRERAARARSHAGAAPLDDERLISMFTQMVRIREFEERVKRTFEDHPGVIRGHTHLADGAEASIVGSLAAMREGDQLMSTYRCHGYPITLGTDTKAIMAEPLGPVLSCTSSPLRSKIPAPLAM